MTFSMNKGRWLTGGSGISSKTPVLRPVNKANKSRKALPAPYLPFVADMDKPEGVQEEFPFCKDIDRSSQLPR